MEQVYVNENLYAEVLNEDIKMCERLWDNLLMRNLHHPTYKNQLKNKKKDLTYKSWFSHMSVKEPNQLKNKDSLSLYSSKAKANMVEYVVPTTKDKIKGKGKKSRLMQQNYANKFSNKI